VAGQSADGTGGAGSGPFPDGAEAAAGFADPVAALAALDAALAYLAHADPGTWSSDVQADCLRTLAVAESRQTAAHASVLAAFSVPGGGLAGDGHRSPRIWLCWQTQATRRAAATSVGWMKRLNGHPVLADALAGGQVSVSWARQLADWTDRLPETARPQADAELLTAAGRGAALSDLFFLAEALRREHAQPDDDEDGFADRGLRLARTFEGAGRLEADLTTRCASAVSAVLDSLAQLRGPEDDRSLPQRQHDALEEACLRLLAAGCLPVRAGQPVRLNLDITLPELLQNTGGLGCDALIQPVITGQVDYGLLEKLADPDYRSQLAATAAAAHTAADRYGPLIAQAIALLSGPSGRAALLRARLAGGPAAPVSLPLDVPGSYDTIPIHLRRAVRRRDKHCRFPGCDMPPDACDVHHIRHRKDGGRHALGNLTLLCRFHHQIAIHRWGWTITLHPDGTTSAVSPDGSKTLHSHTPRATTPAA